MRRLRDDIRDLTKWVECEKRPIVLKCTYRASGALYCNPLDMSTSVSNRNSPVLLTDDFQVYWTESVYSFKKGYVQDDGKEIDSDFIDDMKQGDYLLVRPRKSGRLWAFKVSVELYRWDCPYGANASGVQHGDGDYLVCSGDVKPDLRTIRLVRYEMFKRFYTERSVSC